ncbi:MAG: nucleotidyl transferase AbiEii/AbiGii toxin family protein [Hyphomonas sp.]|uniref:nucleotidyl transferase AbiEii/AbiGii toxin family protein n=1 Tax=Hyphomonas sp. TaxID=87 RepID=UPI0034A03327
MSDAVLELNVAGWVERARANPIAYAQRQAVEVTLNAIAMTAGLKEKLFLKGGVLMGLAYDSPRQTADIDLTAAFEVSPDIDEKIRGLLDGTFPRAAARLGYADLIVRVHSIARQPRAIFETASFPALKIKIAFARRGTPQEVALNKGMMPGKIEVDISFNEPLRQIQVLGLTGGAELYAYDLVELMAEKYRAMLQQKERNRNRRQDVYDLDRLIDGREFTPEVLTHILEVFVAKCQSRNIEPTIDSLDDAEVRRRSAADWQTMQLEIGTLPEFEGCYSRVSSFYRALPWT